MGKWLIFAANNIKDVTDMKRFHQLLIALSALPLGAFAQGWPAGYGGVMLQGFYWDSFKDSRWTNLESLAPELKGYFDLVWVPQSGKCLNSTSMGYDPYYYWNQNSSFGTEDQLRSMIKTFKDNGIGTIADVVVNHRNTTGWFTFPAETYKGVTYQMQSTDIVANDDGGATATQARKDGVSLSQNNDEGEDWSGMRDLDHKSQNVQTIVKAYENFLVNDLGYSGFRYDMVKGFSGSHVGDYNEAAGVRFSVGECWDSNSTIENWIKATGKRSAAFDFQFRYNVRDAINGSDWTLLNSTNNLVHDADYRQYSVTFVENHDTEYRSASSAQDPIRKDTLAANAYLLAMPGTPCVFYKHYLAYPAEIKGMIDARKAAGITNTSEYAFNGMFSTKNYAVVTVTGTNGQLKCFVGNGWSEKNTYLIGDFTKVLSGYHYAYYLSNGMETPFADKPSGTYNGSVTTTLTAVSATSGAKLVYTLDGSTPTASNGTQVASGTQVTISGNCTLTVGLLVNGAVTKTITRNYTIKEVQPFSPKTITVYVNGDKVGWTSYINFHSFDSETATNNTNTSWPGRRITATKEVGGKKWFYSTYTLNSATDYVSFVFSVGTSATASQSQTVDITNVSDDTFFEISTTKDGNKYTVNDVTATTAIGGVSVSRPSVDSGWYTISGSRLGGKPAQAGLYVHDGKKVVVK